jgi:hypothetical protein
VRLILRRDVETPSGGGRGGHGQRGSGELARRPTGGSSRAPQKHKTFRCLEIEEGHVAIVQADIDAVSGIGFWFDVKEFDLDKN